MKEFKKILLAVLCAFVIVSSAVLPSASAQEQNEIKYRRNGRIYVDFPLHQSSDIDADNARAEADFPSSYDSRDYGYITEAKDQGDYGACWAFAAMNASEASLIKNNGFDKDEINLSEIHLCYTTYGKSFDALGLLNGDKCELSSDYSSFGAIDIGGYQQYSVMSLARWGGVVDENKHKEFAYENASRTYTFDDPSKVYALDEVHLTDSYWIFMDDISGVKSMIMQYGAGDVGYYHDDITYDGKYYSDKYNSYCLIQNVSEHSYLFEYPNHEISIIGWDDSFPKEHFVCMPSNDGAWLVKNSWGSEFGDDGCFWLSYEDSSLLTDICCFYKFASADNYDNNYQYDGTCNYNGEYSQFGMGYPGGGYMANVFTAFDDEILKAVSFYNYDENLKYSVDVYTGLESDDPLSGQKAATLSGVMERCGYHTLELPKSIRLSKAEKFSVVVRFYSTSSSHIYLPCDRSDSYELTHSFISSAQAGQSFFSSDGKAWEDLSKSENINFRIKAFTSNISDNADTETDSNIDTTTDTQINTDTQSDTASDNSDVLSDTDTQTEIDTKESDTEIQPPLDTDTQQATDTQAAPNEVYGDADGDGKIKMLDVTCIQKFIAQLTSFSSNQLKYADVNLDRDVNMADVVLIQKYLADLIDVLPNTKEEPENLLDRSYIQYKRFEDKHKPLREIFNT